MNHPRKRAPSPQGHLQSVDRQLGSEMISHRQADYCYLRIYGLPLHNTAWGVFTATSYTVFVNKYLVGDYGILILLGAVTGAIWVGHTLMRRDPDETRLSIASGKAPVV